MASQDETLNAELAKLAANNASYDAKIGTFTAKIAEVHDLHDSQSAKALSDNSVTTAKVADNSVTLAKLDTATVTPRLLPASTGTAGQTLTTTATGAAWRDFVAVSAGAVLFHASGVLPEGWLECDGSSLSRTIYADLFAAIGTTFGGGDGSTTFKIPDLRGEFVRGWDHGRGVDNGRSFGIYQEDLLKTHRHRSGLGTGGVDLNQELNNNYERSVRQTRLGGVARWATLYSTFTLEPDVTHGAETRPRNIALLACIKY